MMVQLDDFVSDVVAEHAAKTVAEANRWHPGRVFNSGTGRSEYNPGFRCCDEIWPEDFPETAEVAKTLYDIFGNAAKAAGIDAEVDGMEKPRVVRYPAHKGFHPHVDKVDAVPGQLRKYGAVLYLNNPGNGGYTEFFRPERRVFKPKAGRLILFPVSPEHVHEGAPATRERYIAVTWFYRKQD